jgi:hypothetical protein
MEDTTMTTMDKKMTSFPLFSHLRNEIDGNDAMELSVAQRTELIEKIKELNEQGCSLIYALIRYYQIYELQENAIDTPFGMKKIKTGYRFCIEDLPPLLQNLITRFVDIHLQSQKERLS